MARPQSRLPHVAFRRETLDHHRVTPYSLTLAITGSSSNKKRLPTYALLNTPSMERTMDRPAQCTLMPTSAEQRKTLNSVTYLCFSSPGPRKNSLWVSKKPRMLTVSTRFAHPRAWPNRCVQMKGSPYPLHSGDKGANKRHQWRHIMSHAPRTWPTKKETTKPKQPDYTNRNDRMDAPLRMYRAPSRSATDGYRCAWMLTVTTRGRCPARSASQANFR